MSVNQESEMVKEYQLSGGGVVKVYKPFGSAQYFAIVEQDGEYPEPGKIAINSGRSEYSVILDGAFDYEVNGKTTELTKGMHILVPDKASYRIRGKGRIMVFVQDAAGGATQIK